MRLPDILLILSLLALLPAGNTAQAEENAERHQLLARRSQLQETVQRLQQEQTLLLFRKRMYSADSKYLVLDLSSGRGQLWYRSRLLREFPIRSLDRGETNRARPELAAVTDRSPWEKGPRLLVFADRLVLSAGRRSRSEGTPAAADRVTLSRRDMTSLFYALDKGSLAYVLP